LEVVALKIAFCGTHGTGKTTLVLQMAATIKSTYPAKRVGITTEQARNCPLPINEQARLESQLWIYHSQFVAEIEAQAHNDIVACDRSVLDAVAYAGYHGMDNLVANCQAQVQAWWKTYETVVFCRPNTLPVADGVRSNNRHFQMAVHRWFERLLQDWDLPVIELNGSSRQLLNLIKLPSRQPQLRLIAGAA